MKNKIKTSPKVSARISVRQTYIFATVGIAIFLLVSIGVFFYLNLGTSDHAYGATRNYTSKDNYNGRWEEESTWDKRYNWLGNVPQNESYYTAEVLGLVTYESSSNGNDPFVVSNGSTLDVTDTLVIKSDALFSGGGNINVSPSGVLVVLGDLTLAGGSSLNNTGRVVVTENLRATGGARINNSATGNNGFYTYGARTQNGGGNGGNNHKTEAQLESNDPSLYKFVSDGGVVLLPIVLDYFKAELTASRSILIEWGTVTEKDNDFFTLERSRDGKVFEEIATKSGAGNSNSKLSYSIEDKDITAGMNYYRLKQTDFNGDHEYFKIIGVNNPTSSANNAAANSPVDMNKTWPNPFKDKVHLSFNDDQGGDVEVVIQNSRGEIVHKEMIATYSGENSYSFDNGDQLQPGVYFINIWKNGKKHQPQRLIKM